MKKHFCITTVLTLACAFAASAHALWIETEARATIGKLHALKVCYGEAGACDPVSDWSDPKTFAIYLISPDGKKTKLTHISADDHYNATFTPEKEGVYMIVTNHVPKELDGKYMYQFNASALVNVGQSRTVTKDLSFNDLYVELADNAKGAKSATLRAYYKGKAAVKADIAVTGPTGWSKTFVTDGNGQVAFEPLWDGDYSFEAFYTVEETGKHHEQQYDHIWRCATTKASVTK